MPYSIEKLPGEPIVVIRIDGSDMSMESAQTFARELTGLLDAQRQTVVLINVMPENYRISMDGILEATQLIRAQSHIYHHPNIKGVAAVTTDQGLKMAYEGLSNEVFGGIYVQAFDTLDNALDFARRRD